MTEVPVGLAVGTAFTRGDGDAIGFYVVKDVGNPERMCIEDEGETVPYLDACGADVTEEGPRGDAFAALLDEYGASYDADDSTIKTELMSEAELPDAAVRFVALLLRMQDFLLVTRERAEATFRNDVVSALQSRFLSRAAVETDYVFTEELKNYPSDVALVAEGVPPLAIFIGTSDVRVPPLAIFIGTSDVRALEAMLFYNQITFKHPIDCKVMLIINTTGSKRIRTRTLDRVVNEIPIATFRDEPDAALNSIERQFLGGVEMVH